MPEDNEPQPSEIPPSAISLRAMGRRTTDRPRITSDITDRIVDAFRKSDKVDFAIPWVYSYRKATGQTDS